MQVTTASNCIIKSPKVKFKVSLKYRSMISFACIIIASSYVDMPSDYHSFT